MVLTTNEIQDVENGLNYTKQHENHKELRIECHKQSIGSFKQVLSQEQSIEHKLE